MEPHRVTVLDKRMMGVPHSRHRHDDDGSAYAELVSRVIKLHRKGHAIAAIAELAETSTTEVARILQGRNTVQQRLTLLDGIKRVPMYRCSGCGKCVRYSPCQICVALRAKATGLQRRRSE